MKVLGISLEGSTAIFSALEKTGSEITDVSEKFRKIELKNHLESAEVQALYKALHTYFDEQNFDKIAIIKRGTKGSFAASPISFKIEGLIQTYKNNTVEFIAPATLRAFYKKNTNSVAPKYNYQKAANNLAYYLLEK